MTEHSRLRRLVAHMEAIHGAIDCAVEDYSNNPGNTRPTCGRGCAGCCYQLVASSVVECIPIAAESLANPIRYERVLDVLKLHADIVQDPEMDTAKWFLSQRQCAFLNDNSECTIYSRRPIACRTLQVIGDPTGCYPDSGMRKVTMVDFSEINKMAYADHRKLARGVNLPHEFQAPMPIAMLWSTKICTQGIDSFLKDLRDTSYMNREENIRYWARMQAPIHAAKVKEQDNDVHTETAPGGATPMGKA